MDYKIKPMILPPNLIEPTLHKDDTQTDIIIELQNALDHCRDELHKLDQKNGILELHLERRSFELEKLATENKVLRELLPDKNSQLASMAAIICSGMIGEAFKINQNADSTRYLSQRQIAKDCIMQAHAILREIQGDSYEL